MIEVLVLEENIQRKKLTFPDWVNVFYDGEEKELFDIVFVMRTIQWEDVQNLYRHIKAYTLFVSSKAEVNDAMRWLMKSRKGRIIPEEEMQGFINDKISYYFSKPYGEKFQFKNLAIAADFKGKIEWHGLNGVRLEGDFGDTHNQILFWKNNIPVFHRQSIEFWLEYDKSENVEVILEITQMKKGTISEIVKKWSFTDEDMQDLVRIENDEQDCMLFVSVLAKGTGYLTITSLHDRHSRNKEGAFLPGGIRRVTKNREEVFFYFDPGNLKPPLNIYFSGYKTLEGFEAYSMMKSLGSPFLLIAESRLEGGAFYIGDKEYENLIINEISEIMKELNFRSDQMLFCGLSMGTYGALYYSCYFNPYAVVIGKPLINLGNIAKNGRLFRPEVFATSLDVLYKNYGDLEEKSIEAFNERFWKLYNVSNWKDTKLMAAYMIEDDYDASAYQDMVSHTEGSGIKIYGKGLHGRHNDDTDGVVLWFYKQLENIVKNEFHNEGDCNGN